MIGDRVAATNRVAITYRRFIDLPTPQETGASLWWDVAFGTTISGNRLTSWADHILGKTWTGAGPDWIPNNFGTLAAPRFSAAGSVMGSSTGVTFTVADAIQASSGLIMMVIRPTSITGDSASGQSDDVVFTTSGAWIMMTMRATGPTLYAVNYDSNYDQAAGSCAIGTTAIQTWRHDGGVIGTRNNAGAEATAASGNTGSLAPSLTLGGSGRFDLGDIICDKTYDATREIAYRSYLAKKFGITF